MKRLWLAGGITLALAFFIGGGARSRPSAEATSGSSLQGKELKKTRVRFRSGQSILADVVDTPEDRTRGLMFRTSLPKDTGMLFVFAAESNYTFWMKNTWMSLDIVFIDKNKVITRIYERVKPSTEQTPDAEIARVGGWAQFVLELPAGTAKSMQLAEGQHLDFDVAIPGR